MKPILPSKNSQQWPRKAAPSVKCRKQDLVIRITNWLKDKDEPGYDVEVYIGGVYDWNESRCFSLSSGLTPLEAKVHAAVFAGEQARKLL